MKNKHGKLNSMCLCGHMLGSHAASNHSDEYPCFIEDETAVFCDCRNFFPQPSKSEKKRMSYFTTDKKTTSLCPKCAGVMLENVGCVDCKNTDWHTAWDDYCKKYAKKGKVYTEEVSGFFAWIIKEEREKVEAEFKLRLYTKNLMSCCFICEKCEKKLLENN